MADRKSFVIYDSWAAMIGALDENKAGQLIKAVCAHQLGCEYTPEDPVIAAALMMIIPQMDEDRKKYEEKCERLSKNSRQIGTEKKQIDSEKKQIETEKDQIGGEYDSEYEYDSESVSEKDKKKERTKRFVPPTVEEVAAYCRERGNKVDPEAFVAFYESKGWKVGSAPMKAWKPCVITWEKRDTRGPTQVVVHKKENPFTDYSQRDTDWNALQRQILRRGG